jgi:RecA-family ATPase
MPDETPPDEPEDPPPVIKLRRDNGGVGVEGMRPFAFMEADSWPDEASTRQWHVQGLIPCRNVTSLSADGAVGKSLLMLQLCAATVLRKPFLGLETQAGTALFITAEDDKDELHRRLVDITRHEQALMADLHGLTLVSLVEQDAVLGRVMKSGVLEFTSAYWQLDASLRERQPTLVILDTLADLFSGNENDRGAARQFIGALRKLAIRHDTTIVLLAHPSLAGLNSGSGLSGSTAWNNSVRSRLYLERILSDEDRSEPNPDARVLRTVKANYAAKDQEIHLTWRNGVFIHKHLSGLAKLASIEQAQEVFLRLLRIYRSEGRDVSPRPCQTYAPALFAKDHRAEGLAAAVLRAAMNILLEQRRITIISVGSASRQRQRLELP